MLNFTLLTSPELSASSASIILPVSNKEAAVDGPTRLGKKCVAAMPEIYKWSTYYCFHRIAIYSYIDPKNYILRSFTIIHSAYLDVVQFLRS